MIPERFQNFLQEISGKFPIGNFGKLPRPITCGHLHQQLLKFKPYLLSEDLSHSLTLDVDYCSMSRDGTRKLSEISERKFRYLSGIIPFFKLLHQYILEVCLIRPALAGNAGYFIPLEEEGASGILCHIDYKTLTTKKYIPFDYGRKYMRFLI